MKIQLKKNMDFIIFSVLKHHENEAGDAAHAQIIESPHHENASYEKSDSPGLDSQNSEVRYSFYLFKKFYIISRTKNYFKMSYVISLSPSWSSSRQIVKQ